MFTVVMVAIVLLGGLGALGYAGYEGGDETTVTNETFQPTDGATIQLQHSELENTLYSSTVNVTNVTDTTVYPADGNYTWNDGNGTIYVEPNSPLSNQTDAHITYSYSESNAESYAFLQMFGSFAEFGDALVIALVAAAVLAAARVLGGAG